MRAFILRMETSEDHEIHVVLKKYPRLVNIQYSFYLNWVKINYKYIIFILKINTEIYLIDDNYNLQKNSLTETFCYILIYFIWHILLSPIKIHAWKWS